MLKLATVVATLALCGTAMAQATAPAKQPSDKKAPAKEGVPATPLVKPAGQPEKKSAAPTLKVGDAAPAIAVDNWVKGEPVSGLEKGKVHVVEFWATWCPPCRDSIPHLTELQKKHKDVIFIGMASSERKPKEGQADKRLETLQKFVRDQGAKMEYRVAFDANRANVAKWMEPAGQQGIPVAFVVDTEGKIAWIGHPMDEGFEKAIAAASGKGAKSAEPAKKGA